MNKDPDATVGSYKAASSFNFDQRHEIQTVLSHLFDVIFPIAITFGAISLIISLYRSFYYGWLSTFFLHTTMYLSALIVIVFRHRIPVSLNFSFLLGLMYISMIHSFYQMGLAGEGMMTMAMICVFSGVFLGIRQGMIIVFIGVFSLLIIGANQHPYNPHKVQYHL